MDERKLPHDHGQSMERELDHMPSAEDFQTAADIFKQLGDGSRIRIFWLLCHCEECVINLSSMVDMSSPAVSHHLKQLKAARLIVSRREGKEVYYKAAETEQAQLLHHMIEAMVEIACPSSAGGQVPARRAARPPVPRTARNPLPLPARRGRGFLHPGNGSDLQQGAALFQRQRMAEGPVVETAVRCKMGRPVRRSRGVSPIAVKIRQKRSDEGVSRPQCVHCPDRVSPSLPESPPGDPAAAPDPHGKDHLRDAAAGGILRKGPHLFQRAAAGGEECELQDGRQLRHVHMGEPVVGKIHGQVRPPGQPSQHGAGRAAVDAGVDHIKSGGILKVRRRKLQREQILDRLPPVVAGEGPVPVLIQGDEITGGPPRPHPKAAEIHLLRFQCGAEMASRRIIRRHAQIAGGLRPGPAGQHGHIGRIAARIQLLSEQIGVKHIVAQTQQFHRSAPLSISSRPYSGGSSWDVR